MGKKLYVGNLEYGVTDGDLEKMFAPHGTVESAQIIMDRDTGRSKGFGFVEMKTDQEAQAAIAALNGAQSGGRSLTVNEAKPREDRGGRSGGRGGGRQAGGPWGVRRGRAALLRPRPVATAGAVRQAASPTANPPAPSARARDSPGRWPLSFPPPCPSLECKQKRRAANDRTVR